MPDRPRLMILGSGFAAFRLLKAIAARASAVTVVSRLIDYFEANPDAGVDPAKVCITGVSRHGTAALVATAFDPRVAAECQGL
jgi:hypothetical protein